MHLERIVFVKFCVVHLEIRLFVVMRSRLITQLTKCNRKITYEKFLLIHMVFFSSIPIWTLCRAGRKTIGFYVARFKRSKKKRILVSVNLRRFLWQSRNIFF